MLAHVVRAERGNNLPKFRKWRGAEGPYSPEDDLILPTIPLDDEEAVA